MSEKLRVVTYNVHGQKDDRAALVSVIRELAPDVLLVQEAPRRFRWRPKCAALAHDVGLVVACGGGEAMGNLILVDLRVSVAETRSIRFPLTPGRHLRGAAIATCIVNGGRFVVAGCHIATDPLERPSQAALLRKALAGAADPVIIGADLNDQPGSPAWQVVAEGLVDTGADAVAAVPTFSCASPRRRIDAIFVDPRITVVACQVIDTPAVRRASDHFPVVADLLLPA
jgi:endonuclease/exonuclease/phosphatase family metal-dependent hydrolase